MTVSGKVLKLGDPRGNITVGQVFNPADGVPLCELMYSGNRAGFQLFYEEAQGSSSTTDLKTPVALNSPYTFMLSLSNGILTVTINDQQVYTHTPSAGVAAKRFYFKYGNYDQSASAGPISTVPYSIVENYSAVVVHQ
jgi:hypothetical protein